MSLDYQVKKPTNLTKINSNDFGELLWWSYVFGVTLEKLLTTIEKVGDSTDAVGKSIKQENWRPSIIK